MSAKDRILAENQADADQRLKELKIEETMTGDPANSAEMSEGKYELIVHPYYEAGIERVELDKMLREKLHKEMEERLGRLDSQEAADREGSAAWWDQNDYVGGTSYRDIEDGEIVHRTAQGELSGDDFYLYATGHTREELENEEKWWDEREEADRREWEADPANRQPEAEQ